MRSGRQQVHRHHGELQRRAALQEEHPVAVVDARQVAARLLRVLDDLVEHLAAMAVLADPEPAAGHVPDVLLRLLEHGLGKHRRAGAEVPDAVGHLSISVRSSEMMCELPLRIAWSCSGAGPSVQVDPRQRRRGTVVDDVLHFLDVDGTVGQHLEHVRQHAGTIVVPHREHVRRRASRQPVDAVGHDPRMQELLHDVDDLVRDRHLRLVGGGTDVMGAVDARQLHHRRARSPPWSRPARPRTRRVLPGCPRVFTASARAASSTTDPREVLMR